MVKISIFILTFLYFSLAQDIQPVRIHYDGGGDWYGNKTTWPNVLEKARIDAGLKTTKHETSYRILDPEFMQFPIAYISGHGNISFSDQEAATLRQYLITGGFLFADDDYGMDRSFRREIKKVFPELELVQLPFSHPIYHIFYQFPKGLPKIHEHDGGPPIGLGLIYNDRLVCFYSRNTDLSDGCEDENIHNDPPEKREQALRMVMNILIYALLN
jgi:hypothetical protein